LTARLCDLARAARRLGVTITTPSSGSHWKAEKAGCRPYTLPCHNGERTELDSKYVKGFCRHFGIEPKDLQDLL
jgi:hypothetical protein